MMRILKNVAKRMLSLTMAVIMVLSLCPVIPFEAHAAELLGHGVNGLKVDTGDNGTWKVNGSGFEGSVSGKAGDCGGESTSTDLTLENTLGEEAKLSFTYSFTANGGSLSGDITTSANQSNIVFEKTLTAGQSVKITIQSGSGSDKTSTLTVTDLKLIPTSGGDATLTVKLAQGGSVSVDGTAVSEEMAFTGELGKSYQLVATPDSSNQFFAWYDGNSNISYDSTFTCTPVADMTVTPVFVAKDTAIFEVDGVRYTDLNAADNAAKTASKKVITLVDDGTLPSGNYTISSGNTLLIPKDDANTVNEATPACHENDPNVVNPTPTVYRTLTMASGANIAVYGKLNVAGGQNAVQRYNGTPTGPVGVIDMQSGSSITMYSGSNLYAWGYIIGQGSVTAKSGATVYESFQLTDFRGGNALITSGIANNNYAVFCMSQYYIQNIEVPLTLEAGATEKAYMGTNAGRLGINGTHVEMISSASSTTVSGYKTFKMVQSVRFQKTFSGQRVKITNTQCCQLDIIQPDTFSWEFDS